MLTRLFSWQKGSVVTLVPNSGVQFLDFGLTPAYAAAVQSQFHVEPTGDPDADGQREVIINVVERDENKEPYYTDLATNLHHPVSEDDVFSIRGEQALDAWAGRWLPAPVLRVQEDGVLADGPWNWARIFVTRVEPDLDPHGNRWRLTLALDTLLSDRRSDRGYLMPEPRDATEMAPFGLATSFRDANVFLRTPWVRGWLLDSYLAAESVRRKRKVSRKDLKDLGSPGQYLTSYLALLNLFDATKERDAKFPAGPVIPRLRFLDEAPYLRDRKPIPVNLVIDIGNSRTCGILIEEGSEGSQRLDMTQAYRLELRDLSRPAQTYADPFESRVEFHSANFNFGAYSKMAGRPMRDAFWWPSPVRVGPEAAWLASLTDGTHGQSGLSSPKRYIWDRSERTSPWVNNSGLLPVDERVPPIRGPIPSRLDQAGQPLRENAPPGMKAGYSRSSLYMLTLCEILTHAMIQINAPSTRAHRSRSEEPRQLRRIILTIPSATPVAEQKALKKLVKSAVKLLWEVMGWDANQPLRTAPELKLDWDEATATHLVYLYNEITQKLQTAPSDCFAILRRNRQDSQGRPMLRVASMDMGGGTTDLMIIQHEVTDNDRTILPRQLFREGFRLAGDDILKQVIEDEVLPSLGKALAGAGISRPDNFLVERFSGDREGMSQQERTLRALFVNQVLRPAALALLARSEVAGRRLEREPITMRLTDTFPFKDLRPAVAGYVEEAARRSGAANFSLEQVMLETRYDRVAGTVSGVVGPMLTDLCDVVRAYECDVLLLSGRPSCLPVIKDLIIGQAPVPPGRIIPMDTYEVGNWYPFNSPTFRIEDPKTTAAVGAMLCQVCEGQVEGMLVRSSEIRMKSTARYIGVMERNDQIRSQRLIFSDVDLDQRADNQRSQSVAVTPPAFIGYRQLPLERWKTTPLYFLEFKDARNVGALTMPLTVTLERAGGDGVEDESVGEEFTVREARDAKNVDVGNSMLRLGFQTLRVERDLEAGYWLDSGVLSINWRS